MRFDYEPSRKLKNYLSKIQNETGRKIVFERTNRIRSGMAFRHHPNYVLVGIASTFDMKHDISRTERSIAHEVTHGFLIYRKGYCHPVFKRSATHNEKGYVDVLWTTSTDIAVNKIVHEEGFPLFSPVYIGEVKKETNSLRKGEDHYRMFSYDPLLRDRFMVSRYILAWGSLKYFSLEPSVHQTIEEFLKTFAEKCLKQFEMASQVRTIFLQNDIFTAEGHNNVMKGLVKLWGLEDLVELKTEKKP